MQEQQSSNGRRGIADDDGIGQVTECGSHRSLITVLDRHHLRDCAEYAGLLPRAQHGARSVAPGEADTESFDARRESRTLTFAVSLLTAQTFDLGVRRHETTLRLLVLRIQAKFTGVESGHLAFESGKVALRLTRSRPSIFALSRQALDLRRASLKAGARCSDPTGEPHQAFATI